MRFYFILKILISYFLKNGSFLCVFLSGFIQKHKSNAPRYKAIQDFFLFVLNPILYRGRWTRTELSSCEEAIDGKKVNIAYFVIPVTKLEVRVNLGLLPTLISLKLVPNSKLILTSTCVPTSKPAPISNLKPMSKCLRQTWYQQHQSWYQLQRGFQLQCFNNLNICKDF